MGVVQDGGTTLSAVKVKSQWMHLSPVRKAICLEGWWACKLKNWHLHLHCFQHGADGKGTLHTCLREPQRIPYLRFSWTFSCPKLCQVTTAPCPKAAAYRWGWLYMQFIKEHAARKGGFEISMSARFKTGRSEGRAFPPQGERFGDFWECTLVPLMEVTP